MHVSVSLVHIFSCVYVQNVGLNEDSSSFQAAKRNVYYTVDLCTLLLATVVSSTIVPCTYGSNYKNVTTRTSIHVHAVPSLEQQTVPDPLLFLCWYSLAASLLLLSPHHVS